MTYKKDNCADFGPVDVFQFESDSVGQSYFLH